MKPIHLITIISILALAGCAHEEPKPPKTQESFSTLITSNGAKQFSYILTMKMPIQDPDDHGHQGHGGRGGHGGGHGDGPRGDHKGKSHNPDNDSKQDDFELKFDDELNSKINTTGFCRTGFKQLQTQSRRGAIMYQGECNETASDADREKFPNPAPKKVKEDVLE